MLYLTAASGRRAGLGGGNPNWPTGTTSTPECVQQAIDLGLTDAIRNGVITDTVWSYDLGLKSSWLDRKIGLNAAIYQVNWKDYQQTILLNYVNRNCQEIYSANVGDARIRGIEIEAVLRPTEHVMINSAISVSDGQFVNVPPGVGSSLANVPLKDGDRLRAHAPYTVAIGAEYRNTIFPILGQSTSAYIRTDWRYVPERMNLFGDKSVLRQDPTLAMYFSDAYSLLDLRAGVEIGQEWSMQLYVANVLDTRAEYESSQNGSQPAIRYGGINQPRSLGFNMTKRF
jgi:iron complex outermembrane receptor protein